MGRAEQSSIRCSNSSFVDACHEDYARNESIIATLDHWLPKSNAMESKDQSLACTGYPIQQQRKNADNHSICPWWEKAKRIAFVLEECKC
mmetsp:Transcript_10096/g.21152  ORF Transcript_10096/g.21152 Transcript_10096/m.21152 type:complete len:90 (+) Transcript_10096:501-770(+)